MDINAILEANGNLFQTSFPESNISFTYRILTLKEYKVFKGLRDGGVLPEHLVSEMIFDRCYVGNPDLLSPDLPAGITTTIGNLIMHVSGDCDQETLKEDLYAARQINEANTVYEYMRSAIITAFPAYTIENMDDWTRRQFLQNFTIAENVLSKQNPEYKILDINEIKTSEEIEKEKKKTQNHNIDFKKQNREIKHEMGPWAEEEYEKYRSKKLSPEQLTRLSEFRQAGQGG
jgi:hypothetical protein